MQKQYSKTLEMCRLRIRGVDKWSKSETVHTSFCKFVLVVSKYASSLAVLGELGMYPTTHKVYVAHILYWLRLKQGTASLLTKKDIL